MTGGKTKFWFYFINNQVLHHANILRNFWSAASTNFFACSLAIVQVQWHLDADVHFLFYPRICVKLNSMFKKSRPWWLFCQCGFMCRSIIWRSQATKYSQQTYGYEAKFNNIRNCVDLLHSVLRCDFDCWFATTSYRDRAMGFEKHEEMSSCYFGEDARNVLRRFPV